MKHNYSFTYKRVFLRPLEERDIEPLRVLRNKNLQYFNDGKPITPEQQKAWFEKYLTKEDDCMFAAELVDKPGEFIGAIAFYDIDWEAKTGEGGRTIVDKEKAPEKGIGTEMSSTLAQIEFAQMGMKESRCYVHKDNERAIAMNIKMGHKIIGERGNELCMAITPESFILPE